MLCDNILNYSLAISQFFIKLNTNLGLSRDLSAMVYQSCNEDASEIDHEAVYSQNLVDSNSSEMCTLSELPSNNEHLKSRSQMSKDVLSRKVFLTEYYVNKILL